LPRSVPDADRSVIYEFAMDRLKSGALPAHHSLWPHDRHGLEDSRKPAIQLDEKQAITVGELSPTAHLALQHNQHCLSAAFSASSQLLGLKNDASRFKRKNISAAIAADVKRFCHEIKRDEVFGTHRTPKAALDTLTDFDKALDDENVRNRLLDLGVLVRLEQVMVALTRSSWRHDRDAVSAARLASHHHSVGKPGLPKRSHLAVRILL
jgi:hypothetical protein